MKAREPEAVRLVMSLFSADGPLIIEAVRLLQDRFGPVDLLGEPMDFSHHTSYYEEEFGSSLVRRMISFEELIKVDALPSVKLFTNGLEERYSREGRRRINIDPGYMALEKFVLASCKNFSHRIYLGSGVYGDLTFMYQGTDFVSLPWTYPDYNTPEMLSILMDIRKRYAFKAGKGLKIG